MVLFISLRWLCRIPLTPLALPLARQCLFAPISHHSCCLWILFTFYLPRRTECVKSCHSGAHPSAVCLFSHWSIHFSVSCQYWFVMPRADNTALIRSQFVGVLSIIWTYLSACIIILNSKDKTTIFIPVNHFKLLWQICLFFSEVSWVRLLLLFYNARTVKFVKPWCILRFKLQWLLKNKV